MDLFRAQEIPNSDEVNVKCISCDKGLESLHFGSRPTPANRDAWDGALVHDVAAGYGSRFDEHAYLIGICDDCTELLVEQGRMIDLGTLRYGAG